MALIANLGGEGTGELFVGEDKAIYLEVVDRHGSEDEAQWTPLDIFGWGILFDVRKKDGSPDPAILAIMADIIGTFAPTRSANTQRARVLLSDTQMNTVKKHTYRHSWKRMDDGSETVLAWGDFAPDKATAP